MPLRLNHRSTLVFCPVNMAAFSVPRKDCDKARLAENGMPNAAYGNFTLKEY